ncbi:hypothetical protein AMTRI_Chr09g19780 [Amborella trichopoda]
MDPSTIILSWIQRLFFLDLLGSIYHFPKKIHLPFSILQCRFFSFGSDASSLWIYLPFSISQCRFFVLDPFTVFRTSHPKESIYCYRKESIYCISG